MPKSISAGIDKWIAKQPEPKPSRPEVIRKALQDWLTDRGLIKASAPDHPKPTGPATDAFDKMHEDIEKDRKGRKKK